MRAWILLLPWIVTAAPGAAPAEDPLAPARRAFRYRDHGTAERLLLTRLVEAPRDVEAAKLLVEVYLRMERPARAGRVLEKLRPLAPEDPEVRASTWEVELSREDYSDRARKRVRAEIDAFLAATPPGGPRWRLVAALLGYGLVDAREAKDRLLARIIEEHPRELPEEVEGDAFESIITERDPPKRASRIRRFLRLFPDSKQAGTVREILLYTLRGDRKRLLAAAEEMLAKDPADRRVHAALARWLLTTDPPDAARALPHVERALTLLEKPRERDRPELTSDEDWARMLRRTRGRYLSWRGRARQLRGDLPGARAAFDEAAAILPFDVNLYLWRGELLLSLSRREEAIDAFARSLASGPSPEAERRLRELLPAGKVLRAWLAPRLGPAPRFTEATGAAGLGGVRGGRVALADVNGDGFPDLLVGGSRLFLNRGDGSFAPAPGFPAVRGARGGLFADLDDDGDLDLFVFRTAHPLVLENDGKGGFSDRTPAALKRKGTFRTEAAAIFDFDGDGLLDVYLANYERPPTPPWARGTPDVLLRNRGGLAFADATDRISGVSPEPMCGRGAAAADFDEDGDRDLYVANYRLDPDFLLVNGGDGRLANEARARGVEGECDEGYFGHGIGPVFGDLDGDGHLDLVVGNLAHPRYIGFSDVTRIFLSSGPPSYTFRDVFRESGVRYEETHSNVSLGDVDLDGDLDLYLTSIYRGRKAFLYLNDGKAHFRDVTWLAGVRKDNGWGSAFGDVDLDGDLDLVVGSGSGVSLYRNEGPVGSFLGLTLRGGEGTNAAGVGARVTVISGGRAQVREVRCGTGTGCQDDPSLRFGLGASRDPVTLVVRWPNGREQRILGVAPNRIYRLVEGGNLERIR